MEDFVAKILSGKERGLRQYCDYNKATEEMEYYPGYDDMIRYIKSVAIVETSHKYTNAAPNEIESIVDAQITALRNKIKSELVM